MYRFIGDQWSYDFINGWANEIAIIVAFLFIGAKIKVPGVLSRVLNNCVVYKSEKHQKFVTVIVSCIGLYFALWQVYYTPALNDDFGNLVGTGFNYYGSLFSIPLVILIVSIVLLIDPLKFADILIMSAPIFLFVVKIACFCNGCCWGISWEHGMYNHHPGHPGNQVPVQAIEAVLALAIFGFLLFYRKKAKTGTLLPIYMILYSVTRFPVEFFSAAHEPIIGPFNTYHFLCVAGVIVGLIMLLIVRVFGKKISSFFESMQNKVLNIFPQKKEAKAKKLEEEAANAQSAEEARLEKVRLARAKAKARRGK